MEKADWEKAMEARRTSRDLLLRACEKAGVPLDDVDIRIERAARQAVELCSLDEAIEMRVVLDAGSRPRGVEEAFPRLDNDLSFVAFLATAKRVVVTITCEK